MKNVTNNSASNSRGSEKWLLILVVIAGIAGLLLTFQSTPGEEPLDVKGIQLESRTEQPSASVEVEQDYVLR